MMAWLEFGKKSIPGKKLFTSKKVIWLLFYREIPQGGLLTPVNEPLAIFGAHPDKCQIVKFHPLAKDVLLTAGFDKLVKIWDLNNTNEAKIVLQVKIQNLSTLKNEVAIAK